MAKSSQPLSIKAMAAHARRVPKKPTYICSHEVGHITDLLYKKGLTWKEIQAFFVERGHSWNPASLKNGHTLWKKKRGGKR